MYKCPRCGSSRLIRDHVSGYLVCGECGEVIEGTNICFDSYHNHEFLDDWKRREEKLRRRKWTWAGTVSTEPGDSRSASRVRYFITELLRDREPGLIGLVSDLPAPSLNELYTSFIKAVSNRIEESEAIHLFEEACKLANAPEPAKLQVDKVKEKLAGAVSDIRLAEKLLNSKAEGVKELFVEFLEASGLGYRKARRKFEQACAAAGVKLPDLAPTAVFEEKDYGRRIMNRRLRIEKAWKEAEEKYGSEVVVLARKLTYAFPELFQPEDPLTMAEAVACFLNPLLGKPSRKARLRFNRLKVLVDSSPILMLYRLGSEVAEKLTGRRLRYVESKPAYARRYRYVKSAEKGETKLVLKSKTLVKALEALEKPLKPRDLAKEMGISTNYARVLIHRLKELGLITRLNGHYISVTRRHSENGYLLGTSEGDSGLEKHYRLVTRRRVWRGNRRGEQKHGKHYISVTRRRDGNGDHLGTFTKISVKLIRDPYELALRYNNYPIYVEICKKLLVEPLSRNDYLAERFIHEKLESARRAYKEYCITRARPEENREALEKQFLKLLSAQVFNENLSGKGLGPRLVLASHNV